MGFGAVVGGSVLSAEAVEEVAVVGCFTARVAGCCTISLVLDCCVATDTANGLASSVRRLRGRDLRGLGYFCAGAMVVDDKAEATLICDAVGACRENVVGRGSFDCFGSAPVLSGC